MRKLVFPLSQTFLKWYDLCWETCPNGIFFFLIKEKQLNIFCGVNVHVKYEKIKCNAGLSHFISCLIQIQILASRHISRFECTYLFWFERAPRISLGSLSEMEFFYHLGRSWKSAHSRRSMLLVIRQDNQLTILLCLENCSWASRWCWIRIKC